MTLLAFGYIKSIYLRPAQAVMGALQTLAIGGIAAGCSYGIVALVNSANGESSNNSSTNGASSVSFH